MGNKGSKHGQKQNFKQKEKPTDEKKSYSKERPKHSTSSSSKGFFSSKKKYRASVDRAKGTKILNLSEFGLKRVPREIEGIPLLRSIDLSKNQLSQVDLPALSKLKILNISNNNITDLADCFAGMIKLETLNISNNRLSSVPDTIWGLQRLKTLDLSYNEISTLQGVALSNSRVETLDLSHNRIQIITKELLQMQRLDELKVAYNLITTLPHDWSCAKRLMAVDFEGNKINNIAPSMFKDTQIFRINLVNNPCHPEMWRQFDGFDSYVKRYKSHIDKGLYHGAKVDYGKFV